MATPKTLPFDVSQPTPGWESMALLVCIGQSHRPLAPMARIVDLRSMSEVVLGRGDRDHLEGDSNGQLTFQIDDPWMSTRHASVRAFKTASESLYVLQDEESTNGTRVDGAQVTHHQLSHGEIIETGQTFWRFVNLDAERGNQLLARAHQDGEITYTSTVSLRMLQCLELLRKVAATDIPLILQADTGTGKEVMAGEVHRMSGRTGGFVVLNCPAIPEGLIESELFGHARGAFTGATVEKRGLVEDAHLGTLLLDEIGDMPAAAQAKVLRLLQEGTFTRVGETAERKVDVRFIAATHHDLRRKVQEGGFRADLHARLNGYTCRLPTLQQRIEDIGLLLAVLLRRNLAPGQESVTVDQEVFRALCQYAWPYNIRELEKTVASAMALAGPSGGITLGRLPEDGFGQLQEQARSRDLDIEEESVGYDPDERTRRLTARFTGSKPSDEELRATLEVVLGRTNGNISAAARVMDTSRMQVHRWLKRLGMDADSYR